MLSAALEYLSRGWSVVPCANGQKRPCVRWGPYTTKLPTEETVRKWWAEWPDANIAIICGRVSGLVVVDIDPGAGRAATTKVIPPTGLIAKTGREGGEHRYYAYPPGATNVANQVDMADGYDVRGDGGYVIAPPSLHKSGRRYAWASEGTPGQPPQWAITTHSGVKVHGNSWLTELIDGESEEGQRNSDVARLAGYLAKKHIPEDVAELLVKQWVERQSNPLSKAEVSQTVQSVFRTASRRKIDLVDDSGQLTIELETEGDFPLMKLDAYMRHFGGQESKWLVKDWLPDSTIAFVASPPGGYKTWLTFDLAVSIATGSKFLGDGEVSEPGPVIIVQQEDFHGQVADRIGTITLAKSGGKPGQSENDFHADLPPSGLPIYLHTERLLRFDNLDILGSLERTIATLRPRLVIIDPLYSAASTEDYMAKSVGNMMVLKTLRDKYGTSFMLVHHTKKSAEDWDRQNMWGSQFLNAFLETGWQIRKLGGDDEPVIIVKRHFKSAGSPEQAKVTFEINTGVDYRYSAVVSEVTEEESEQAASKQSKPDTGAFYIDALKSDGPASLQQLAERTGKNKSTVYRAMKRLESKGEVTKDDLGVWSYLEIPDI